MAGVGRSVATDVPSVAPRQIVRADVIPRSRRIDDRAGHPKCFHRRIGAGQFTKPDIGILQVSNPAAASSAEVDGAQVFGSQTETTKMAHEGVPQEPMPAAIPEMPVLHSAQHVKAAAFVFELPVCDGTSRLIDTVMQLVGFVQQEEASGHQAKHTASKAATEETP